MRIKIAQLIIFGIGILLQPSLIFSRDCLSYELSIVEVYGQLHVQSFVDLENFAHRKLQYWILHLPEAICVQAGEELFNEEENEVKSLQLVLSPQQYRDYKNLLNQQVLVKGKLFHAHTAHHHTRVLIEVEQMISQETNKSEKG